MQVLGEQHTALGLARWADSAPLTRERNQHLMITPPILTAGQGTSVPENSAVEVAIERAQYFIAEDPVALREVFFPAVFKLLAVMKDEPIQGRLFRTPSRVANNLLSCTAPRWIDCWLDHPSTALQPRATMRPKTF